MISAGSDATALVALWITLPHDLLKAVRDAVELIAQRGLDAHVAADQVVVPPHADPDGAHAGRAAHGHRTATADRVHDVIAEDGAVVLVSDLRPRQAADQSERAGQRLRAQQAARLGGKVHRFRTLHRGTSEEIDAAQEHLPAAFAARIGTPQRPGVVALLGLGQRAAVREHHAGVGQARRQLRHLPVEASPSISAPAGQ